MPYIFNICLVIEDENENPDAENIIDDAAENAVKEIKSRLNINADYVSCQTIDLNGSDNCGKCSLCGAWVSDHKRENKVSEFSDGIKIGEKWFCDICLHEYHPRHF